MPYITFQQMQTGRLIGTPSYSVAKDDWIEYALVHHASCDTIKMLEDFPKEAYEVKPEDVGIGIRVIPV